MKRVSLVSTVAATMAIGALLASPFASAHAVERPVPPAERLDLVPMVAVDPADFVVEAAELPAELDAALQRDVGLSGAEWLAQAEASAVGIEVVDALREHIDVRNARLDGVELVVTVGSSAEAAVVESIGATAVIGPAAERVSEPIEGLEPAADLRGGVPYFFRPGARCSLGFNGIDTGNASSPVVLTAGHCEGTPGGLREAMIVSQPNVIASPNSSQMQDIGNGGLHVTDAYPTAATGLFYDHGFIPVTEPNWVPKPEIVTWGGTSSGGPLASAPLVIRDLGPALAGSTLCKSGSTTGWTCGPILNVDTIFPVGGSSCNTAAYCVGGILAQLCVRAGDSGGPAVVGSRAVGVTSASSAAPGGCVAGDVGVFSTLDSAGFERVTDLYPAWEPLIGLQAPVLSTGSVNRVDNTVGGSLSGGGVRHDVSLALDLGGTLIDEVSATGAWSIDISAVPNGTRSYTLRSSWGSGAQQSSTVTGQFLKAAPFRLFGDNRYSTAVQIARAQFPGTSTPGGPVTPGVPVVYLANGDSFPDALSAGPAAALEGGPLLLTAATSLPAAVAAELDRLNPQRVVVVGGTGVLSAAVAAQAGAYAVETPPIRLGGASRYETSQLIAQRMRANGLAAGAGLWVATGADFPDALSAGAAAASQRVPILLVDGVASSLDLGTASFINSTLQSGRVDIAGGTGVVSPGIESSLRALGSATEVTRRGGGDRFTTSLRINQAAYPGSAPEVFFAYAFNFPDALAGSVVAGLRGGPLFITDTPCVSSAIVDQVLTLSPSRLTVFGGTSIVSDSARDLRRC